MRSVILCEGSTDYFLLQHFMDKAYGWSDSKLTYLQQNSSFVKARTLVKENDTVTIAGAGGCDKIMPCLERLLDSNTIANKEEIYKKIVLIVDRDEIDTESDFLNKLKKMLDEKSVEVQGCVKHNEWIKCNYNNGEDITIELFMLVLIIPFEETGALETFLLNAISKKDTYDANIISQCNSFVDNIDEEKRYLNKRRYITKAKFDVYFSVRTATEQFRERRNILKSVDWENYLGIQTTFKKLEELSVNEES